MPDAGLLELATAEHQNAKRLLYNWLPSCHLAAGGLTVVTLFVELPLAYFFALGVLVCQVAAWAIRMRGLGYHRHAEEARRRALLIDALGETAERLDVADIRRRFSKRACEEAHGTRRPTYWGSGLPQGPQRLSRSLQESAFWSKDLYGKAATQMAVGASAAFLVIAAIVLIGLGAFEGDAKLIAARVVAVALSTLIALDLLGQALAWRTAASEAERVDRRLDTTNETSLEPMLAIVADYAVATVSAPPIPDRIYQGEKERLNELWKKHRAGA